LYADDPFEIAMGFSKKLSQPFLSTQGPGEIQFVKNGEFFFLVEDRNIVERDIIYFHAISGE
jgi:hypothetical protein